MDYSFAFVFTYVATYIFVALYSAVIFTRLSTDLGRQLEVFFFRLMVIALIIYCITESLWAVGNFGYSPALNRANMPLTIINHVMITSICTMWFAYMESYLQSEIANRRKLLLLTFIPFGIIALLTITTPLTDLVFNFDTNGAITRGPAYILTIVVSYGYALVATVRALISAGSAEGRSRRSELLTMALFIIPPAAAGLIDTFIPFMPIVAPGFFFSYLVVFSMLQESQISTDSLTKLNNRRRAERHFDEMRTQASVKNPYLFFIIDCNQFKKINDTYGHLEGDNALCAVASALRDACRNSTAFIARWGGDEFVVMVRESEVGPPEVFIDLIADCLLYECYERELPYRQTVSVGYAYCTGASQTKRQILEEADAGLYEQKAKL